MTTTTIRFQIKDLLPVGLTVVVLGIGIAYGLNVLADTKDDLGEDNCADRSDGYTSYNSTSDQCYNSTGSHTQVGTTEFNATGDAISGTAKLPEKLPLIMTVVVAAVIIGVLLRYLVLQYN